MAATPSQRAIMMSFLLFTPRILLAMPIQPPKKRPEDWLESAESAEAPEKRRGRFKVFLGYAPGVGKTYSMLSEGIRRKSRGEDVVIGIVETHGRSGTAEVAQKLERVPPRQIDYKGTIFSEMDVDAVLARAPKVALIDELAHTNIEGSRHPKRYEDVFALLDAGIDVLTTVNIQHIESVTPRVQSLTGITVRETVPDWVLDRADEIVMSDLTPEALATRMRRGDIYPQERVERALANFFRRGNLIALREMALQQVTRAVDRTLDDYVKRKQLGAHWAVAEKIAVCISSSATARDLIARGARLSHGIDAEFFVLHLDSERDTQPTVARALEENIQFAKNLDATVVRLKGSSVATAVAEFAVEHRITQVLFGRSALRGLKRYLYFFAIQKFMSAAPHVDLHIITQERH
jgi:two-component system sensor histidine kinase KdpD